MNLGQIILDIQTSQCCNCKYGKALIVLRDLHEEIKQETPARPAARQKNSRIALRVAGKGEKVCHKCGQSKLYEEFPPNKQCSHGVAGTCKECVRNRVASNRHKRRVKEKALHTEDDGNFPTNCKLCNASISTPGRLASHMRIVHQSTGI